MVSADVEALSERIEIEFHPLAKGKASHKLSREGRKHGLKWQNY